MKKEYERESFTVNENEIKFRRATIADNFEEIARLIYYTDQYIYPFWFGSVEECKRVLPPLMKEDGFIFNYNNIYIAFDTISQKILGVLVAIDKSVYLDYDYSELEKVNHNYEYTIKNYIKPILDEVNAYDDYITLYISNVCIEKKYRGKKIGTKLLGYYLCQMQKNGFEKFNLDCLLHNLRAKNLYHSMGFKEIKEIVGFDGTDESTVEVVSMSKNINEDFVFPFEEIVNIL